MGRARGRKKGPSHSFVALPRRMIRGEPWKSLSPAARELYIQLKGKYNGSNNGQIKLYYSELKDIKGLSSDATISKAIKELKKKEWIEITTKGGLFRYSNEFKLTGKYDEFFF